jgi:hypothetical protein
MTATAKKKSVAAAQSGLEEWINVPDAEFVDILAGYSDEDETYSLVNQHDVIIFLP